MAATNYAEAIWYVIMDTGILVGTGVSMGLGTVAANWSCNNRNNFPPGANFPCIKEHNNCMADVLRCRPEVSGTTNACSQFLLSKNDCRYKTVIAW